MRKLKSLIGFSLACFLSVSVSAAYADPLNEEVPTNDTLPMQINEDFFEEHKKAVVEELLEEHGIQADSNLSLNSLQSEAIEENLKNKLGEDVSQEVEQLLNADYVYMSETGEVYSSKRGYLGQADRVEESETFEEANDMNTDRITIQSQISPTVHEVRGGDSGAFERRQLGFLGFDGIIGDITLPTVSNIASDEQAWMYYGFDSQSGKGVEGGYAHQSGRKVWLPYIKTSKFKYSEPAATHAKNEGNKVNNVKFYLKKTSSSSYYTAYLVVGATEVVFSTTNFTDSDVSGMSVKRTSAIGKKGFNGSNISGRSMNSKFENVQVSKFNSDFYNTWGSYSEYKERKNNIWYGTIDNTPSYIHHSGSTISIYKS